MAKATAICKCAECGTEFEKTKTCYNRTEANNWESWAIQNYTQCPTCWGKEQRKKEQETPLTLNVAINPYDIENPIVLYFTGNTMPEKDKIKALGYYWSELPMTGIFGALSINRPPKRWNKIISLDALENELKQADAIGAKIINKVTDVDIIAYQQIKEKADKEATEKAEKMKDIKKPECPEILFDKRWNGKIYGKSGSYCFYGNNEKITITDEQKKEIENYLTEKEAYKKAIAEIEKSL